MLASRQHQGVDHALGRNGRPARSLQLGVEKGDVKACVAAKAVLPTPLAIFSRIPRISKPSRNSRSPQKARKT
jgi:hypothetical protein